MTTESNEKSSDEAQRYEQFEAYEEKLDELNDALLEAYAAGFAKGAEFVGADPDFDTDVEALKQKEPVQESHYYYWDGKTKPLKNWLREQFLDDEQLVTDGGMNLNMREVIEVERDGEEIEVWNWVNVQQRAAVRGHNPVVEKFDADIGAGDLPDTPEAVTPNVAEELDWEFSIDVEEYGIEVIDPESDEVNVL